jgi:parvulin-like peptidyl-prolyl isomerase
MKGLLREPLLHFLLLGAGLFLLHRVVAGPDGAGAPTEIVVTAGQIEHLAAGFARIWQRPPAAEELKSLIDDWVRDEIATREAVALGLDQGDTVIRRRLRQKLEFLFEDVSTQVEPTDAELNAYLQAHPELFLLKPRLSFQQVYLSPQKRGENLQADAERMLAQLNQAGQAASPTELSDSLLLESAFIDLTEEEIARQFGEEFAASLFDLQPGSWQGPVASGYGMHLVRIQEQNAGGRPLPDETRAAVRREWDNARRLQGNEAFYQSLLQRYSVTIESLSPVAERQPAAGSH